MGHGEVEERAGWYSFIGDRFPVGEALHIRPILLEAGRLGCCRRKCHPAAERIRQDLVQLPLLAGKGGAVRESDPDRGNLLTGAWGLNEGGASIPELPPTRPEILGSTSESQEIEGGIVILKNSSSHINSPVQGLIG